MNEHFVLFVMKIGRSVYSFGVLKISTYKYISSPEIQNHGILSKENKTF